MPKFTGFPRITIRGPRPLPLFGPVLNLMRFLEDPVGRMLALHREYGDIAAVNDGDPALVCAFGAERNREVITGSTVFQHNTEFFFVPPPGSALERSQRSLILLNGEPHHRERRLMMPAFQKPNVDAHAGDVITITDAALETWPVGQTADLSALLRRLTIGVALRCLFGLEAGPAADALGALMTRQLELLTSPLTIALPFQIPGMPFHELCDNAERFSAKLAPLVAEKRRQPPGPIDVLSLMLHSRDEDGSRLTDDAVLGHMVTLFVAGYDTTAQTLTWTLFLLAHRPEILADLLDEIDGVLRGGPPVLEHLPRLVLVDRVLKESMRLLPATPMLFIRVCAAEVPLGPYVLPRAANVILSPLVTHRDPSIYADPNRFRPERWEALQPSHYEYLPFGTGPRVCLGAGFAMLVLRLVLPMILQRYRLHLAHGARVSRSMGGIVLGPKYGMPMLIAPQDRGFRRPEGGRGDIHEICDLS